MIGEQYESMRELSGHKQTLDRMAGKDLANIGLAEFQFDLMLQKKQDWSATQGNCAWGLNWK